MSTLGDREPRGCETPSSLPVSGFRKECRNETNMRGQVALREELWSGLLEDEAPRGLHNCSRPLPVTFMALLDALVHPGRCKTAIRISYFKRITLGRLW